MLLSELHISSHVLLLQPLTDIHLNEEITAPATRTGDRRLVYFFTIIGLITLVIALVNYVNLATARAMNRAREVGVRKVVGAQKKQLVGQFLLESALTNILALVLAITLSILLLPVVNRIAAVEMTRDLWLDGRFWAVYNPTLRAMNLPPAPRSPSREQGASQPPAPYAGGLAPELLR